MKTVFFDVDTQLDFICPAGALYAPGAERLAGTLTALTRFAGSHRIALISTTDAHAEDDPEFGEWPPHCVVGTAGQQKLAGTLLSKPVMVAGTQGALETAAASQFIVQKQKLDAFTNPNLGPLLDRLQPRRVVLYGLVTELCVECAASGLLARGLQVELVTDAIQSLSAERGREMLERFRAKGGVLTSSGAVMAISANA